GAKPGAQKTKPPGSVALANRGRRSKGRGQNMAKTCRHLSFVICPSSVLCHLSSALCPVYPAPDSPRSDGAAIRPRRAASQRSEAMMGLVSWMALGLITAFVAPAFIPAQLRGWQLDYGVRAIGALLIVFGIFSTSYTHVGDGRFAQLFRVYGGGSLSGGKILAVD